MKYLTTLLVFLYALDLNAQEVITYPYNPDADNDQYVFVSDVLSTISNFGSEFIPADIQIDGVNLLQVIQDLQNQIDALSNESQSSTYVARVEFNAAQAVVGGAFVDPSGVGVYSTSATSSLYAGTSLSFTFSNEISPPTSIIVYAVNAATSQYVVTHLNGGGDNIAHKIAGFTFSDYNSEIGGVNQIDANIFNTFATSVVIIDFAKSNFDWNRVGFPVAKEAHAYAVFKFD